jgi:hypothetical protein
MRAFLIFSIIVTFCGASLTVPAAAQTTPDAKKQLNRASQGQRERDHTFDGRKPPPNPVRAQPAQKPNMSGVPASQFKPRPAGQSDVQRMRTNPPPSPNAAPPVRRPAPIAQPRPAPPPAAARATPAAAPVARQSPTPSRPAPAVSTTTTTAPKR